MNSDIVALLFGMVLWLVFAIMNACFEEKNNKPFSKKLITGLSSYWIVLVVVWLFYCWHMWSVYDYSPWPLSLVDKL